MRVEAAAGLACDRVGAMSCERGLGEAGPHPLVDHGGVGLRDDERPQRAVRCRDHGFVPVGLLERRLVAERAQRRTDALEPLGGALGRSNAGGMRQLVSEGDTDTA